MDGDEYFSTAEAADLAGVAASSVKRWADQGLIRCIRTAGGHRRFHRADVLRLLESQRLRAVPSGETGRGGDPWLTLMRAPDEYALLGALFAARGRLGAWFRVADELGASLTVMGEQWERGELSVLDEHFASGRLQRALGQVLPRLPLQPGAPICLLATIEGEEHTLGLSLAEVCLREAGWESAWAGRETPLKDLEEEVRKGHLAMIALSASVTSQDAKKMAMVARRLVKACSEVGTRFVMGGRGAWPDSLQGSLRLTSYSAFNTLLRDEEEARSV